MERYYFNMLRVNWDYQKYIYFRNHRTAVSHVNRARAINDVVHDISSPNIFQDRNQPKKQSTDKS